MKTVTVLTIVFILLSLRTSAQIQDSEGDISTNFSFEKTSYLANTFVDKTQSVFLGCVWQSSQQQFKVYSRKEQKDMWKQMGDSLKSDPISAKEYQAYKTATGFSWVLLAGSIASLTYSLTKTVQSYNETDYDQSEDYLKQAKVGSAVGFGCLLTELLVLISGQKHLKKAVELYEDNHSQLSIDSFSLIYGSESLQLGLKFKF